MFVVAALTFKESVRRRVLLLALIMTVSFLGLYAWGVRSAVAHLAPYGHELASSIMRTQLLVLGLFFGSFILAFLTIFSGVGIVSSELENGVLQTVLTRPLSRTAILTGKYLGLAALLVAYAVAFFIAVVAIVRFYTGLSPAGQPLAVALFCLVPVVLLAVATLGSNSLPTVANGVAVLSLYVVAFLGGMAEQMGAIVDNVTMQRIGIVTGLVLPVDTLYRKMVAVLTGSATDPLAAMREMGPLGCLSEPSVWMIVYTLLYTAVAFGLALRIFARRDV